MSEVRFCVEIKIPRLPYLIKGKLLSELHRTFSVSNKKYIEVKIKSSENVFDTKNYGRHMWFV